MGPMRFDLRAPDRSALGACSLVLVGAMSAACAPSSSRPQNRAPTSAAPTWSPPGAPAAAHAPNPAAASPAPRPAPPPAAAAAAPPNAPCETLTDCAACTARPDCRLCTYLRGCMRIASVQQGACLAEALDSPSQCARDPMHLRAAEKERDVAARRQAIAAMTQGMTQAGPPMQVRLERFGEIDVPVAAGTCHLLVWSLAPDAKVGDVRVSLDFETPHATSGGLAGFDTDTRVGADGPTCSSQPGSIRFRLVDRWTLAPVASGGSGGLTFTLFTRPRTAGDPDESKGGVAAARERGGSIGVDCQDCTFPCESDKTACDNECFRSEQDDRGERSRCERTCEQMYRSCLRHCPGCN
jgi:hypothetical protein